MERSSEDRIIAGVCGGIAASSSVDALWIRLAFFVAGLFTWKALLFYFAAAILMPGDAAGTSPTDRFQATRKQLGSMLASTAPWFGRQVVRFRQSRPYRVRIIVGGSAAAVGLIISLWSFGTTILWWLTPWHVIGFGLLAIGLLVMLAPIDVAGPRK